MDLALIASCALLGLAGAPHCAAMCGAPCAAVTGAGRRTYAGAAAARAIPGPQAMTPALPDLAFHAARAAGYAVVGAVAAAGVGAAAWASAAAPVLRPFWVLLHVAALAIGLWMAATGRQPGWMTRIGRRPLRTAPGGWQVLPLRRRTAAAVAAGALWVGWPCGLLQSALVVAALCNSPAAGAAAMLAFAAASAPGLLALPWALERLGARSEAARASAVSWAVRVAGAALAGGSAFALGQDGWGRALAYCGW